MSQDNRKPLEYLVAETSLGGFRLTNAAAAGSLTTTLPNDPTMNVTGTDAAPLVRQGAVRISPLARSDSTSTDDTVIDPTGLDSLEEFP